MTTPPRNIASEWFEATEALGDFMGIRYGRIPHGSIEPEWLHVSHVECDGIGGFARLLREQGASVDELPTTHSPCGGIIGPIWRLWRSRRKAPACAKRGDWLRGQQPHGDPPCDFAWHTFSVEETSRILDTCHRHHVTANSLLLTHLDASVRPALGLGHARLPWMVPINLRGASKNSNDTDNQVSCVDVVIAPEDRMTDVHSQVLHRLSQGEHRANYLLMQLGRFLGQKRKMRMLARSRSKPEGNIGVFSNLGSWDPQVLIPTRASWVFCPPLVTGQRLAAGCVTFQNRLGLMLHTRTDTTTLPDLARHWMRVWVERITGCR